ncbi:PREDICTED: uncharacterized protein LOC105549813 [Mandrillus leucophaeus]|uniref:uncharacterized protein LOC105549813 n=1 Tax=Mandrillus leucophaeus TaxID=9568 RepID=UPI0005F55036|nr:PREDICTED: uncharacterized protein LOC105549813 [Mandrillus leucophaeus]
MAPLCHLIDKRAVLEDFARRSPPSQPRGHRLRSPVPRPRSVLAANGAQPNRRLQDGGGGKDGGLLGCSPRRAGIPARRWFAPRGETVLPLALGASRLTAEGARRRRTQHSTRRVLERVAASRLYLNTDLQIGLCEAAARGETVAGRRGQSRAPGSQEQFVNVEKAYDNGQYQLLGIPGLSSWCLGLPAPDSLGVSLCPRPHLLYFFPASPYFCFSPFLSLALPTEAEVSERSASSAKTRVKAVPRTGRAITRAHRAFCLLSLGPTLLRPRESRTETFPGMPGLTPARGRTRRWPFPCASGFGITQCTGFNRSQQDAPLLFSEALEPAQLFYKRRWLRLTLDGRLLCMVISEQELTVRVSQSGGVLASKSRGTEEKLWEHKARKWPSASQEERLPQKPTLRAHRSLTFGLQNFEEKKSLLLNHSTFHIFLWQPELTNTLGRWGTFSLLGYTM